jgi:hypothetical protein
VKNSNKEFVDDDQISKMTRKFNKQKTAKFPLSFVKNIQL